MIRKLIFAVALCSVLACSTAAAQFYTRPMPQHRNEVSLSYSIGPGFVDMDSHMTDITALFDDSRIRSSSHHGGAVLSYGRDFSPTMAFTASVGYGKSKFRWEDTMHTKTGDSALDSYTFLIGVKFTWLESINGLGVYSRVEAGASILRLHESRAEGTHRATDETWFGGNFVPIGVDYGRNRWALFGELTFGTSGFLSAGVRYKF